MWTALLSFTFPIQCSRPSLSLPLSLLSDYITITLITAIPSLMLYIYLIFQVLINCIIICVSTLCSIYTIYISQRRCNPHGTFLIPSALQSTDYIKASWAPPFRSRSLILKEIQICVDLNRCIWIDQRNTFLKTFLQARVHRASDCVRKRIGRWRPCTKHNIFFTIKSISLVNRHKAN